MLLEMNATRDGRTERIEPAWAPGDRVEVRDDGFVEEHCEPCGWNLFAPNGQVFAWAETREELEAKIEREKRVGLWR